MKRETRDALIAILTIIGTLTIFVIGGAIGACCGIPAHLASIIVTVLIIGFAILILHLDK